MTTKVLSCDYEEDSEDKEDSEEEKEEDDNLEANVFCIALETIKEELELKARVAFHDVDLSEFKREILRAYWARACLEVEVQLVGANGGI